MSEPQQSEPTAPLFPYERYERDLDGLAHKYQSAAPVPHWFFVDFLDEAVGAAMAAEFPNHDDDTWTQYRHVNENKSGKHERDQLPQLIGQVVDEINSPRFVALVSKLTGIDGLVADITIEGGGMHQATSGGFLNMHTDFTMHRKIPRWRRRVNLIVYLNEDWDVDWGGSIELWSPGMKERVQAYPPLLNQALLFNTPGALHGFPDPLTCPDDRARKSIQFYFYTIDEEEQESPHSTTYHARPEDGELRRFLIRLDNQMLAAYAWLKRRLGVSDDTVSWVLGKLSRRKH